MEFYIAHRSAAEGEEPLAAVFLFEGEKVLPRAAAALRSLHAANR